MYEALVEETGLKGNRATPLMKANLYEVHHTNMPAVLLELGFMDSATDVPIILTEEFADNCAKAIVKVIAERGKLEKKPVEEKKFYRVQVGAFTKRKYAEAMLEKIKAAGFTDVYIKEDK